MFPIPISLGFPICIGVPCTSLKCVVISVALIASDIVIGRMLTVMFPLKVPLGSAGIFVMYIGTL